MCLLFNYFSIKSSSSSRTGPSYVSIGINIDYNNLSNRSTQFEFAILITGIL